MEFYNSEDIFLEAINEANNVQPPAELIGIPIGVELNFNLQQMITAIQYGLTVTIRYRGTTGKSADRWAGGRDRTILPLVIGKNENTGNLLIRGFHLEGWSVAHHGQIQKVWRLFNCANIKKMIFLKTLIRLSPKGYRLNDRVMTETTIKYADFNEIRRNQFKLIQLGKAQESEPELIKKGTSIPRIEVKNTETKINFGNPFTNKLIQNKFLKDYKFSVLRNIADFKQIIVVLGALGTINNSVKLFENKKLLGTFKTIDSFTGDQLKNKKSGYNRGNISKPIPNIQIQGEENVQVQPEVQIETNKEFNLYTFVKKF